MYVFLLFMVAHLYMASREDIMGGATEMSAITNGLRMFKHAK
jgi:Ni,Fe-hydrogenase I cytochrome b subunit